MLSKKNLEDAIDCQNRGCVGCSMLEDTKDCLDNCLKIIAQEALRLKEENELLTGIISMHQSQLEEGAESEI